MNLIKKEERETIKAVMFNFQSIFEQSKDMLVANTTNPSEKNAYYALSNAVFICSGGNYSLAATEVNLNSRIVDVAFALKKTLYVVELKNSVAQITSKDFREEGRDRDNKSTRRAVEIAEQLDGIFYGSTFFERLRILHGIERVIGVGVTVGNLRALESDIGNVKKKGLTKDIVKSVADKWIASSRSHIPSGYEVLLERQQLVSLSRTRETKSRRVQHEVGSAMLVFAKRFC